MKRRKTEKVLTRDQRISLLQNQKVMNGRVFEPTTKNSLGMHELIDAAQFQGRGHLSEWPVSFLHEWEVKVLHEYQHSGR